MSHVGRSSLSSLNQNLSVQQAGQPLLSKTRRPAALPDKPILPYESRRPSLFNVFSRDSSKPYQPQASKGELSVEQTLRRHFSTSPFDTESGITQSQSESIQESMTLPKVASEGKPSLGFNRFGGMLNSFNSIPIVQTDENVEPINERDFSKTQSKPELKPKSHRKSLKHQSREKHIKHKVESAKSRSRQVDIFRQPQNEDLSKSEELMRGQASMSDTDASWMMY